MPVYQYYCKACDKIEEILKSFKEFERKEHCEKCKAEMERQISSNTSFHLKGGGWHNTSYNKYGPKK